MNGVRHPPSLHRTQKLHQPLHRLVDESLNPIGEKAEGRPTRSTTYNIPGFLSSLASGKGLALALGGDWSRVRVGLFGVGGVLQTGRLPERVLGITKHV